MKHDIIDRDTGNIVGCISLGSDNSLPMLVADLSIAHHRLINKLEDKIKTLDERVLSLEQDMMKIDDNTNILSKPL